MHTVALAMSFAIGVLILKRRKNSENVRYVKLNESAADSQHAAMIAKPTSSWDYKKLKEDPEDDDNLAIDNNDEDD